MLKNTSRREQGLTRERIIEASIALLDSRGEAGLTFRALSESLATGAGAIYWHIANKNDLLISACNEIVTRTLSGSVSTASPEHAIRALALGLFDAIDQRPWVGSALTRAPLQAPMVRILEGLGQQVCRLRVPVPQQFAAASALLNYILGVSVQNAANAQIGRALGGDRATILGQVAEAWARLDADEYPFTRSVAAQLPLHDDRADFIAGLDLILHGMTIMQTD